jgi:hypothetical protein
MYLLGFVAEVRTIFIELALDEYWADLRRSHCDA